MIFKEKKDLLWQKLTGTPSEFSLEGRIFHSVCVIGLIVLAYHIPFNIYIGLPMVALISLIMLILLAYTYYLSRVKKKLNTSITIFCILSNVLLGAVYYYNSGIEGTGVLLFSLMAYLFIAIVPRKQYKIWIPFNILVVVGLLTVEYLLPGQIINTYESSWSRYIDFISAYVVVVVIMYYSVKYIRMNYEYERQSTQDKTIAIEEQNAYILVQNAELERLNVEKNKLFSIVAHDLRSPLGSIQGYLELLTQVTLEGDEKQRIEKDLLFITRNTSDMLLNLLSWSKAQMDGVTVKAAVLDLHESLSSVLDIEKSIALNKDIKFQCNIDRSIQVKADIDMLQLVIRNLVNNAIKFTNDGDEIIIDAKIQQDGCLLIIKDSGIGIPYDQQQMVFSLKAKSTFGTKNEKGVGLGLLLCKEFIELQDGKIWFDSIPGTGTTFYILIPVPD